MTSADRPTDGGDRRVWTLTTALVVLAAAGSAVMLRPAFPLDQLWLAAAVAGLFYAAERWVISIRLSDRQHSLTLSELPLTIGLYLLSPPLLLLARGLGVLPALALSRGQRPTKIAFNMVAQWTETLVAVAVLDLIDPQRLLIGYRAVVGPMLVTIVVGAVTAVLLMAVISASSGRLQPAVAGPIFTQSLGPTLATTAFAVSTLVLARVSPWLLWAPALTTWVLLSAYRSHVRLVHVTDRQSRLLQFTRTTTGREGVGPAAAQVVDATMELPGITAVGIATPSVDGSVRWMAGRVELGASPRLALPAALEGGHATFEVNGRRILTWALDDVGTALVVQVDPTLASADDLRRTVDQVANHARVAIANASHAQALRDQARDAAVQALTDPLTGLPNRAALSQAMADALAGGTPFATLLIDLDDFKQINDALGHTAGDQVLWEIGRRMSALPPADALLVRLGGDEFAALVPGGEATARDMAARLLQLIGAPVTLASYSLEVGASVGIALYPDHAQTADELMTYADLSMYEAKADGGGVAVFGAAAAGQAVRQLAISSALRGALAHHQIRAVYQPQIDLRTDRLVGVEALARWTHPDLGAIRPDEFIRIAEQGGLLTELTDAMVEDALTWQRRWAADGFDLQVAVNLSPRSLLDADLPRRLARAVDRHGVPADRLTVEITEGSVMTDPARTRSVLSRISELGMTVSIDDFGTGYSSLAYLQELPADEVKIDKSFVLPMAGRRDALPLVSGIIRLCHELGFTVVAEGVEQPEVQTTLRGLGCDRGQGFAIARPMEAEDVTTWALAHRDRWTVPQERPLN